MNGRSLRLPLTPRQCITLIGSITLTKSIRPGTRLHALILTSGILTPFLSSKIAAMYSLSNLPDTARHLFDQMPQRTTFLYNTLIRGYVQTSRHEEALSLFSQMHSAAIAAADNFTYPFVLKACGELFLIRLGTQIHSLTLCSGLLSYGFVANSLIAMYTNCAGDVSTALAVFEEMGVERSVVSWNSVIAGLVRSGRDEEALAIFDRMVGDGVEIDRATVVSVLPACAHLKDLARGEWVHDLAEEYGFGLDVPVRNSLIDMYAKCGELEQARRVFGDDTCKNDIVSWTVMIGAYASNRGFSEALDLSYQMQVSGTRPNAVTMACLLSACGALPSITHGKCGHGTCVRLALNSDIIVETALIDMYAKCNAVDMSRQVFAIGSRRTATWNALLSGLTRIGRSRGAIEQFKSMMSEGASTNLATMASILPAYSHSADLQQAMNIHCYLLRTGFIQSIEASTGMIDVYTKVGCLDTAWKLFDALAVKDFVSWSAIIGGYGMHGHATTAIRLLDRMVESGVEPNEVTFTSLLYSCSHAGLVDEGLRLFDRMTVIHRLRPRDDHYACVVDLLSRVGRLDEAYGVIASMPSDANHAVWGALLGGCVIHANVELGQVAAQRLFEIEPENTGNYVLLGNIYAAVGQWEDAERLRRRSIDMGLKKEPGHSLVCR